MNEMERLAAAIVAESSRTHQRYFADADELFEFVRVQGRTFVDEVFSGRLKSGYEVDGDLKQAVFEVSCGVGAGSIAFRYRVESAGLVSGEPVSDLFAEGIWFKPKFRGSSAKVGNDLANGKLGIWNRAAGSFRAVE